MGLDATCAHKEVLYYEELLFCGKNGGLRKIGDNVAQLWPNVPL